MRRCRHPTGESTVCNAPTAHPERRYEFWCEQHRPPFLFEAFRWHLYIEEAARECERPRCARCLVYVPEGAEFCAAHVKRPAAATAEDRDSATDDQGGEPARKRKATTPPPVRLFPCASKQCRARGMVTTSGTLCADCNKAWPRGGLDITRAVAPPTLGAPARTQSASTVGK